MLKFNRVLVRLSAAGLGLSLVISGGAGAFADPTPQVDLAEIASASESTDAARDAVSTAVNATPAGEQEIKKLVEGTLDTDTGELSAETSETGKSRTSEATEDPEIAEMLEYLPAAMPDTVGISLPNPENRGALELSLSTSGASNTVDGVTQGDIAGGGEGIAHVSSSEGAQVIAVLDASSEAKYVDFNLSLPEGMKLDKLDDGSLDIVSAGGQSEGRISAPWATDSTGAALPTHYEVTAEGIRQYVDTSGAEGSVAVDPSAAWWAANAAKCAVGVAPFLALGAGALALKAPRLISKINSLVKGSKAVAKTVKALGGAKKAAVSLIKAAIIKVRNAIPAKFRKTVPAPKLDAKTRDLANGLYGAIGGALFSILGIDGCLALITRK